MGSAQPIPQLAVPDSLTAPREIELLDIDASSWFSAKSPHVGDTLSYIISVEWINPKIPFMVLSPESLSFAGFKKTGAATDHKKIARSGENGQPELLNRSIYSFKLKAVQSGAGKASSARVPYFSVASQDKEYFQVSPAIIDILPARVPFFKRWYITIILLLLAAAGAAAGGRYGLNLMKNRKRKEKKPAENFTADLKELRSRLAVAEPLQLLLQMEDIAVRYLRAQAPGGGAGSKFEAMLNHLLEKTGGQNETHWKKLLQDFELARFGGGRKERHELLDDFKSLKICLNLNEEEEHE